MVESALANTVPFVTNYTTHCGEWKLDGSCAKHLCVQTSSRYNGESTAIKLICCFPAMLGGVMFFYLLRNTPISQVDEDVYEEQQRRLLHMKNLSIKHQLHEADLHKGLSGLVLAAEEKAHPNHKLWPGMHNPSLEAGKKDAGDPVEAKEA